MGTNYRNKNRGYQQLRVWNDPVDLYVLTCRVFQGFPYELKRVAAQEIASIDSVHRNIAEGYCRRSIREYLHGLNIGLGSLGESVSGLVAYQKAAQITEPQFKELNDLAFKLENGLLRLVESLEHKERADDWIDSLILKESNVAYGESATPSLHHSDPPFCPAPTTPPLHRSSTPTSSVPTTPLLQHSTTPGPE